MLKSPKNVRVVTAQSVTSRNQDSIVITDDFIRISGAPRAFGGYPVAVLFKHAPNGADSATWRGAVRLRKNQEPTYINVAFLPKPSDKMCLRNILQTWPLGEITLLVPRKDLQHLSDICAKLGFGLKTHHYKSEIRI